MLYYEGLKLAMETGAHLRLNTWPVTRQIWWSSEDLRGFVDENDVEYTPSPQDMASNGWEVVTVPLNDIELRGAWERRAQESLAKSKSERDRRAIVAKVLRQCAQELQDRKLAPPEPKAPRKPRDPNAPVDPNRPKRGRPRKNPLPPQQAAVTGADDFDGPITPPGSPMPIQPTQ